MSVPFCLSRKSKLEPGKGFRSRYGYCSAVQSRGNTNAGKRPPSPYRFFKLVGPNLWNGPPPWSMSHLPARPARITNLRVTLKDWVDSSLPVNASTLVYTTSNWTPVIFENVHLPSVMENIDHMTVPFLPADRYIGLPLSQKTSLLGTCHLLWCICLQRDFLQDRLGIYFKGTFPLLEPWSVASCCWPRIFFSSIASLMGFNSLADPVHLPISHRKGPTDKQTLVKGCFLSSLHRLQISLLDYNSA